MFIGISSLNFFILYSQFTYSKLIQYICVLMVPANRCKGEPSCNRPRVARQSKLTLVGLTSAREWSVIFTCWGSHRDVYQHLNAVNYGKEPIACILQVKKFSRSPCSCNTGELSRTSEHLTGLALMLRIFGTFSLISYKFSSYFRFRFRSENCQNRT